MRRFLYIASAAVALLAAWVIFISPAWDKYSSARDSAQEQQQSLDTAKKSGYRVSQKDENNLNVAEGQDWGPATTGTGYSVITQSRKGATFVGPEQGLGQFLNQVTGANISEDPVYGILRLPDEVAPIIPLEDISVDFLGNGQSQIVINNVD